LGQSIVCVSAVKPRCYASGSQESVVVSGSLGHPFGGRFHGRTTANGERFDSHGSYTAAHRTLPFNVCAEVQAIPSGRSVIVRINDRGPFARGRLIDLSRAAAEEIGVTNTGLARVRVAAVGVADADGSCRSV